MLTVILNPRSGSAGQDFRTRVEDALKIAGADYEIFETTPEVSGRELALRALQNGARHLLACGGDGTVMTVVNAIGQSGLAGPQDAQGGSDGPPVRLSIVPGGTANLLAGALKIPTALEDAIATALRGRDHALDLGVCGEHWFALGLGLGLTEKLVSQTSAKEKEKLGKLAYVRAMLRELGTRPNAFTLTLDGGRPQLRAGVAIVVANAGEIGGGLKFAPDAKIDDGLLDVCVLHRFHLRDVLRLIWRSLLGEVRADRAVSFYQARRVEVASKPPLDLQIDGEPVDKVDPLVAEIVPHAILVRVPQETLQEKLEAALPAAAQRLPLVRLALLCALLGMGGWGLIVRRYRRRG